jgi:GxxExxY protein
MNRQGAKTAKDFVWREPGAALDAAAHRVIGAALEVHSLLGPGFLESVYEEALCAELTLRSIRFQRQVPVSVSYKGRTVGESRLDVLVDRSLVVELKAVDAIAPIHVAQVISYLKAADLRLGLIITFNVVALRRGIKRVIRTH